MDETKKITQIVDRLSDAKVASVEIAGSYGAVVVMPVDGSGNITSGLTDTELRASPVVVSIKETLPTDALNNNASLTISNTDSVQASTKVITKTVGATSYEKTLSLNAGGDVIAVSAWVQV